MLISKYFTILSKITTNERFDMFCVDKDVMQQVGKDENSEM